MYGLVSDCLRVSGHKLTHEDYLSKCCTPTICSAIYVYDSPHIFNSLQYLTRTSLELKLVAYIGIKSYAYVRKLHIF